MDDDMNELGSRQYTAASALRLSALAGLAALAAMMTATSAYAQGLTAFRPHRAVYDLALEKASDRSGIRGLRGRIVYELTGSVCDGFSSRYRYVTDVEVGNKVLRNDQRSTTFESPNGEGFTFVNQYYLNNQKELDLRGEAKRTTGGIAVKLKKPDQRDVTLDDALFMNQHLARIIETAKAGETILSEKVYDASNDGDALVDTNAVIGSSTVPSEPFEGETEEVASALKGREAWPVSVSYYDQAVDDSGGERTPSYQVSFLLYEDGVSRKLTMRYDDYSMTGSLASLDYLPEEKCD